jgi:formamidopyrimidine-DNA glycosylase
LRDFVDSDGNTGNHQEQLQVYGRKGESCHRCGTLIQRMVISQRSTCFCPDCQPPSGRSRARIR